MVEKLRIKIIYYDFLSKVNLTEEQIKILDMMIQKNKIIKISLEMGMSERNIGYEIQKIKKAYKNYVEMEKTKYEALTT